jgi:aryl-alcohol dehydrogenase-like predicted oxidoreductase
VDETLPALRKLQAQGKARFVGITGLPLKAFRYVLERAEVDTVLSYCHYSLNDTALENLIPTLHQKQVGIVNASPLSMGLLSERGAPGWHPAAEEIRGACARAAAFCRAQGTDIAQLAVQFSVSNPNLATTLVGTANPQNMEKNARWADTPPDPALLAEVLRILAPIHNQTWLQGRPENN